jgi:hypothetical protein
MTAAKPGMEAMATKFSLTGGMIPRAVARMFDQRSEERVEATAEHAVLDYRGSKRAVKLLNVSRWGAMIGLPETLNIGERVGLQVLDRKTVSGFVRWVRDDRIGLNFDTPLD